AWSLYKARTGWTRGGDSPQHAGRATLVMLAMLGVHSLLEYPLWYAYFLLPTAWALGRFIAYARPAPAPAPAGAAVRSSVTLRAAGALIILGAFSAAWDHHRVEVIFAPPAGAGPLAERVERGQRSALFGHHADYAAVTTPPRDQRLSTFHRPLHQLVDV